VQREDPEGIVILCDFCRREWDGQEAMIEGHHGSVLCLVCLEKALREQAAGGEKFKCTMCLRFNMPPEMPHWRNPAHPEAVVCQECIYQSAKAFHKNKEVAFRWDPSDYPPPYKAAKPMKEM
jgi:hypothetical protein